MAVFTFFSARGIDMNEHAPSGLREEYCTLLMATIQRYVADGHSLSIETTSLRDSTRVSFDFDPAVFADYFAHMGDIVASDRTTR
jgi:hypothetical protein